MQIKFLLLALFFSFSASSLLAQAALNQKINEILAPYQQDLHPGLALGIWKDGKVLFSEGYGLASIEHQVPFTPQTVSDIGSVAKQLTCFAVVLLEQKGALSFEDPVQQYLDYVPDFEAPILIKTVASFHKKPNMIHQFICC